MIRQVALFCVAIAPLANAYSGEWSLAADVNAGLEYNDNITLKVNPVSEDAVTATRITPSLIGSIKETNWTAQLQAKISDINYSNDDFDTTNQYLNLSGDYRLERDIFSFSTAYILDSSLNPDSGEIGLSRENVDKETKSINLQYRRLITERLNASLSYDASDVGFLNAETARFRPYFLHSITGSLQYALSTSNTMTLSLQGIDYASDDDSLAYQLFTSRLGINYSISETVMTDFSIGVSNNRSSNLNTVEVDFFGVPIPRSQVIDVETRGYLANIGISKNLESAEMSANIGRDETTNSVGGLDIVDSLQFDYNEKVSSLFNYAIVFGYQQLRAAAAGVRGSDRDVLSFEVRAGYSIARNWSVNASYRQLRRDFVRTTGVVDTPRSNILFVGMTYNFDPISTF